MGNPERRVRRICRQAVYTGRVLGLSVALAGAAAVVCMPPASVAQATAQRVVQGKVQRGSGETAQGAIVYLKNAKTLEVRTYISTTDGNFRFGQLSPDADYTLWAEFQGKKSKEKTISSFDTKKTFDITLKIDG